MDAADTHGGKPAPRGIEVEFRSGALRRYQDSYDLNERPDHGDEMAWELRRTEYSWRFEWGVALIEVTTTRWEHSGAPDEDKPVPIPPRGHEPVGVTHENVAMFPAGELARLERYTVLGPDWRPTYEGATDFPDSR